MAQAGSSEAADRLDVNIVSTESLRAGLSPRLGGEDPTHARALAEIAPSLPPILVHRSSMRVIDGMHRLLAARMRGDPEVEVRFFDGDDVEAFVAAVRANVSHGLPLTLADRQAAAKRILAWQPQRSDRWIGQVTGLAGGTVAAIRRRMGGPAAQGDATTSGEANGEANGATRVGRDGRVRPLSAAEGRLRAAEVIRNQPEASLREIARAAGISPATAKDVKERLSRGQDPLLSSQQIARDQRAVLDGARTRPTNFPPGSHLQSPVGPHHQRADPASSLRELMRDPSLRYRESGRALLRQLDLQARGPGSLAALIELAPPHCGHLIADIARGCARQWLDLAVSTERRLAVSPGQRPVAAGSGAQAGR